MTHATCRDFDKGAAQTPPQVGHGESRRPPASFMQLEIGPDTVPDPPRACFVVLVSNIFLLPMFLLRSGERKRVSFCHRNARHNSQGLSLFTVQQIHQKTQRNNEQPTMSRGICLFSEKDLIMRQRHGQVPVRAMQCSGVQRERAA